MIVATLASQGNGNVRFLTGALQQFRAKLLAEELVGVAIIDQKLGKPGTILDQGDGVMLAPGFLVAAKIAAQRLGAHGTCDGTTIGAKALAAR